MKFDTRMHLWGAAVISISLSAFGVSATAQSTAPLTLKFSHQNPAASPIHKEPIETFLANIQAKSKGRIKTEYYPSETLVKAKGALAAVRSGVAEIQIVTTAYDPDATPMANMYMLPYAHKSAVDGFTSFMNLKDTYMAPELNRLGVKLLGVYILSPYIIFSADKAINNLGDLAGMKVRSPGAAVSRILTKVGATPVSVTASDQYEALQKRTVNAVTHTMGYLGDVIKIYETTKTGYAVDVGGLGTALALILINGKTWDKLAPDLQKLLAEEGKDLGYKISLNYDQQDAKALKTMLEHGVKHIVWNKAAKDELSARVAEVWQDEAKRWDARGFPATKLINEFKAGK